MNSANRACSGATFAQIACVLSIGFVANEPATALESPPVEAFARLPHVDQVSISADRRFLSYVTTQADVRSVVVQDRSRKLPLRQVFSNAAQPGVDVRHCAWANPTRLLCELTQVAGRPSPGSPRSALVHHLARKLLAVNFDGTQPTLLCSDDPATPVTICGQVIQWHTDTPDTVLVEFNIGGCYGVYRVNVNTGTRQLIKEMAKPSQFIADASGEVRLIRILTSQTYHRRLLGSDDWEPYGVFEFAERPTGLRPLMTLPGTNRFLGTQLLGDHLALWKGDLRDEENRELVVGVAPFDVGDLAVNRFGSVLGVNYDGARPGTHYLDMRARSVAEAADRLFPDTFNSIHDMTVDGSAYIVTSSSDVNAGTFHVLDTTETAPQFEQIGSAYPELSNVTLGRMEPVEYPARDGVLIPAYLTRPAGASATSPGPLIVLPHDGPLARVRWAFDYLRAFLTSRGYTVLEMNYRGSLGYGWEWLEAGLREWHTVIHDDIHDGARWAVTQGIADPKRICIAGRGFGGFQALLGAAHDNLYRCAISIGAWTNLVDARDYAGHWVSGSSDRKELPGRNRTRLRSRSPVFRVDEVRVPILLVHAELDWNVPSTQTMIMAKALQKECKPHDMLIIDGVDQSFKSQASRVELLSAIEHFLAEHMSDGADSGKPRDEDAPCS